MDVIHNAVTKLRGIITIDSTPGRGTTFIIRLPLTMSVTRALLLRACGETFALPFNALTHAAVYRPENVVKKEGRRYLRVGEEELPAARLSDLLKLSGPSENKPEEWPVLLLKSGDYSIALITDQVMEGRDVVLKSLGAHLGRVPMLLGATLLGDGRVVPILNPVELVQQAVTGSLQLRPTVRPRPVKRTLSVMIVDDSPSVRRIMSKMAEGQGWKPILAKDGLDALETLQQPQEPPDIILLDMEMPRMDGYELLAALRTETVWANIPTVMITSRAGDKHRNKAMELGASDYIVKPYRDEVLCSTIRRLTHSPS
jgi:chemosensory pili system protein ChpA (sensor histidine kinase/response regulator)